MKIGDHVTLELLEIEHIRSVLEHTDSVGDAAEWLGLDRATLCRKIEKYGINCVNFAPHPPPPFAPPPVNGRPLPSPDRLPGEAGGITSMDH